MGLLDKAKAAAETATTKAKEGIGDVQAKRELGQAYDELGKLTYDLAESGEISHERIGELVERIRTLKSEPEEAAAG
jgi:hypothetical protein